MKLSWLLLVTCLKYGHSASVNNGVFIVTPEARSFRDGPVFIPTPLPDVEIRKSTTTTTTEGSPDLIMAEFKAGSSKRGEKSSDGILTVREMLEQEIKRGTRRPTQAPVNTQFRDVWDIIQHNKKEEVQKKEVQKEEVYKEDVRKEEVYKEDFQKEEPAPSTYKPIRVNPSIKTYSAYGKDRDSAEVIPAGSSVERIPNEKNSTESSEDDLSTLPGDESRRIRDRKIWSHDDSRRPYLSNQQLYSNSYYPTRKYQQYQPYNQRKPVIQDRFHPSLPYLPPKKPDAMPPPPVPMPPPPPPPAPAKDMNAPPMSYENFASNDGLYVYSKPTDPPAPLPEKPKEEKPTAPMDSPPSGPSGDDPGVIYPDDHHHHFDYHDFHDFHEHHHEHHTEPPPPPPPPTTTTAAPMERVNNRYSYYYLGKKLWYLPLYFSVYFIIYVGALIIKSIARHKITYPQHYKTKRSLVSDWKLSEENVQLLTNILAKAVLKYGKKYIGSR